VFLLVLQRKRPQRLNVFCGKSDAEASTHGERVRYTAMQSTPTHEKRVRCRAMPTGIDPGKHFWST
jgi:hypothetical protein